MTDNPRVLDAASLARIIRTIRLIAFDFDGVFTDNSVYVFEDGREAVRCTRSDGMGLAKLTGLGIATVVISTEPNPVVSARSRKLKIDCIQDCADKRAAIDQVAGNLGLTLEQVAFVGNDINDLPCLTAVGLPIVVGDAHPDVVQWAAYQTKKFGGYGAVREVCDLFEAALRGES
ncbi:MAG TPA: HAD hydrolase family protein [Pyrinomonadaceae bacterium]|nr:HAD hydrolase family protein [Pyrinomonadaceae bacterium]